jgi:hypothetical protein
MPSAKISAWVYATMGELAQPAQAGRPPEFLVNAFLAQK